MSMTCAQAWNTSRIILFCSQKIIVDISLKSTVNIFTLEHHYHLTMKYSKMLYIGKKKKKGESVTQNINKDNYLEGTKSYDYFKYEAYMQATKIEQENGQEVS